MTTTFYSFPRSTATQKVRLCQHHKGALFDEERLIDLTRLDQLDPAFLAVNPRGQVPALVVDGVAIAESSIINELLEELHPERPLLPRDPLLRAQVRQWTKYVDLGPTVAIASPTFRAWVAPALTGHPDPGALLGRLAAVPEPVTRARWQRTVRGAISEQEVAEAWAHVGEMFARMEAMLAAGPWLIGDAYSLADAEATPIVVRTAHLGRAEVIASHPRVAAWFERVQALPNFAPTYAFVHAA